MPRGPRRNEDGHETGIASTRRGHLNKHCDIAVITNARAARQWSMIGYGELLLRELATFAPRVCEWRSSSSLAGRLPAAGAGRHLAKAARDVDRFLLSPARLAGRRADIVHVVDPGNAIYLDVVARRRSIVTVHDMIPYLCLEGRLHGFQPSRNGRRLMSSILARLRAADIVICVSDATRRDLLSLGGFDESRLHVVHNALFQKLATASPAACTALRHELGIQPEALVLLHVGAGFYKNRAAVLEVFRLVRRSIPAAWLVLVGGGHTGSPAPSTGEGDILEREHVIELAHIDAARLATLYSTATALVFPSFYEGFGYPVVEAQSCGLPVICSNVGSLPEVTGVAALQFAPDDIDGMAKAAISIASDRAIAEDMSRRGRINAGRFSIANWVAAHRAIYAGLGHAA